MDFKVGDRVVGVGSEGGVDITGMAGRVVAIHDESIAPIGVEFDNSFSGGHTCSISDGEDRSKDHHGWWCNPSVLSHEGKKEGQMKKHLSIKVKTVKGWGKLLRIIEQTCREGDFGNVNEEEKFFHFRYDDFILTSGAYPAIGSDQLYVRGAKKEKDNEVLLVPSEEWLIDCCAAVKAYNKQFAGEEEKITAEDTEIIE